MTAAPFENARLSNSADSPLAELIDQFSSRIQAGLPADVEQFAQAHPQYADRLRRLLPAVQALAQVQSAASNRAASLATADSEDSAIALEVATLGDYRILREVGRGGMGVVYEAEQISLNRRVALKVLPYAATLERRNLQRFQNEARAAAHLHHTNIVPVYGTGCECNLHYYAMQFIEGETLAHLIHNRRTARQPVATTAVRKSNRAPRNPVAETPTGPYVPTIPAAAHSTHLSGRPAHYRLMARFGIQAAEALEHAHQSGVVHRDIKPGNVMIDQDGHVWITDFGLAHMQGEPGVTMSGDLIGTLRYMSPEQALAKRGVVDHRTDIYSLGVTLYEFLTLTDAYTGRDRVELLRRIVESEPVAPRRINKAIPTDLETILLKAMAKNPVDRYATAQEFADDLRRFLNDEPILAKRPSLPQRAGKWARRHRALVCGVLSAMVLALAGMMVACALLWWEREKTEGQRISAERSAKTAREQRGLAEEREAAAEEASKRANERFRLAMKMVDFISLNLAGDKFARELQLQPIQREFMAKALDFSKQLSQSFRIPPDESYELAIAQFRMAEIQERLGDLAQAEKMYLEAIALIRKVVAEKIARPVGYFDPNYRLMLATCHLNLANLSRETNRMVVSEEQVAREMEDFNKQVQNWIKGCPLLPYQRNNLASVYCSYGDLQFASGKVDKAEAHFRKALEVCKKLAEEHIREINPWAWINLFEIERDLGGLLQFTGRMDEAEPLLRRAVEDSRTAIAVLANARADKSAHYLPDEAEVCSESAWTGLEWGIFLFASKRLGEAEAALQEASATTTTLIHEQPTRPRYRELGARISVQLAMVQLDKGDLASAEKSCRDAIPASERLAADFPAIPHYQENLARAEHQLGRCLAAKGDLDGATVQLDRAIAHQKRAVELLAKQPVYRRSLEAQLRNLTEVLVRKGDASEARARLEDAAAWLQDHNWTDEEVKRFRHDVESAIRLNTSAE